MPVGDRELRRHSSRPRVARTSRRAFRPGEDRRRAIGHTVRMRTARSLAVVAAALLLVPSSFRARPAAADDRLPGEADALTDKVKADATALIATIVSGKGDVLAARRALLKLGPVVWPLVENASRLLPPEEAKPHFGLLKALLLKKSEPEFEALRGKLRRRFLVDDKELKAVQADLLEFRLGLPDPDHKGKRLPLSVKPTPLGHVAVFRSADASIVLAFGGDADEKRPDCQETVMTDDIAGFVAAIGGKSVPFERQSGKGGDVTVNAAHGFAFAWATDGAPGKAPGGAGGDAGVAIAKGGAGQYVHNGNGGKGAPG
jgi:hypothetical protein